MILHAISYAAIADGAEVIVKLDGDGQMDPALIPRLVRPVLDGEADYAKGNRFFELGGLEPMPRIRLIGNSLLSFASKLSSGYWNVFDPTNGFTALHISMVHAVLGEPDESLAALTTAQSRGYFIRVEERSPEFDILRGLPEFQELLK